MATENLLVLGKSDATITMIADILNSLNVHPVLHILNNYNLPVEFPFQHPDFQYVMCTEWNDWNSHCLLGVNKPWTKKKMVKLFEENHPKYTNCIHASCQISTTVQMGKGVLMNSLVSVAAMTILEDFVSINRNASVGHHTTIKKYVTINPGVVVAGNVHIGENTLLGAGCVVIDGVSVGKNTIIGAGSVVTKDVPDGVVAYGNPCKTIRENEAQSV